MVFLCRKALPFVSALLQFSEIENKHFLCTIKDSRRIMYPSDLFSKYILLGFSSYGNLSRNWLTDVTFLNLVCTVFLCSGQETHITFKMWTCYRFVSYTLYSVLSQNFLQLWICVGVYKSENKTKQNLFTNLMAVFWHTKIHMHKIIRAFPPTKDFAPLFWENFVCKYFF